jgi:hypothetical protein
MPLLAASLAVAVPPAMYRFPWVAVVGTVVWRLA